METEKSKALDLAIEQIERQFGKGSVMRLGEGSAKLTVEVIPTGSLSLDLALGAGGIPRGRITVSVGLATYPADGRDAHTLIRNVDKALYRAKLTGKDKTVAWEAFNPYPKMP